MQPDRLAFEIQIAAQFRRELYATLRIHLRFRTEVGGRESYILGGTGIVGIAFKELFVFFPDGDRVYCGYAAIQAGHKEPFFGQATQESLELGRELEAAFVVEPGRVHASGTFRRL